MRFLVTGVTSGVGRVVAEDLRSAGHTVFGVGRDHEKLVELQTAGIRPITMDFEEISPQRATECFRELGPLDGIFHAAGAESVTTLRATGDAAYRKAMTFADSTFAILRAASAPGVVADGGSIVVMSSVAAHRGAVAMGPYGAARAAAEALVRAAAAELAPRRIRVNAIAAGGFQSQIHDRLTRRLPGPAFDAYGKKHPLGFGTAEDVAAAVMALLAGPWTTGSTQILDGGFLSA